MLQILKGWYFKQLVHCWYHCRRAGGGTLSYVGIGLAQGLSSTSLQAPDPTSAPREQRTLIGLFVKYGFSKSSMLAESLKQFDGTA